MHHRLPRCLERRHLVAALTAGCLIILSLMPVSAGPAASWSMPATSSPSAELPGPAVLGSNGPHSAGALAPGVSVGPEPVGPEGQLLGPSVDSPIAANPDIAEWVDATLASLPAQMEDPFDILDGCIETEMAQTNTPGASVAVAMNGVLTYTKGYGVKHAEEGGQVDPETLFRIGSTTKMMTAAGALQLVESGQMAMDAPLTDAIQNLDLADPWDASSLTLRDLLTHSGQLPDNYYISDPTTPLAAWAEFVLPLVPLTANPGSFFNYSNPNFSLAGLAIQSVTGQDYYDYMPEHVWGPAGMPLTTLDPEAVLLHGNFATGHEGSARLGPAAWDVPAVAPAGMAFSTPTELITWTLTLMDEGGDVLSPESAEALQARQMTLDYVPWMDYGYGVFVTDFGVIGEPDRRVTVRDHGGNIGGGSSQLFWIPEEQFAVSILASTSRSLSGSAQCALEVLAGVEPLSMSEYETGPEDWEPFPGTYSMLDLYLRPFTAQVGLVSDTLTMTYTDMTSYADPVVGRLVGNTFRMVPAVADAFGLDYTGDGTIDSPLDFTFIRDRDNPSEVDYLRQRLTVGQRVGEFPESVAIEGSGCVPVPITAAMDLTEVSVTTAGPSAPAVLANQAIGQDDPADPTTASFRHALRLEHAAPLLEVILRGEPDDQLAVYLLHDQNGDGQVDFPAEALAQGDGSPNAKAIYYAGTAPAGDYEIWVHGSAVSGDDSTFDLGIRAVSGDGLTVTGAPTELGAGETAEMEVCASDVTGLAGQRTGLVQFEYGSPPRLVRVMVDWHPATPLFLPTAMNGVSGR